MAEDALRSTLGEFVAVDTAGTGTGTGTGTAAAGPAALRQVGANETTALSMGPRST